MENTSPLFHPVANDLTTATTTPNSVTKTDDTAITICPFRICQQPPSFVFINEWFEFQIKIHINNNENSMDVDSIRITLDGSGTVQANLQQLTSDESIYVVKCKLFDDCPTNVVRLRLSTNDMTTSNFLLSDTITLVEYKLQIQADWESIWYKDEGGRDKAMNLNVSLIHSSGKLVLPLSSSIPLQVTLYYSSTPPIPVWKQDILRSLSESNKLDSKTGTAALRVRIDDVSKNHQGQDFCIQVATTDHRIPIAPAFSPSIHVRSKRNKRHLRNSSSTATTSPPPTRPIPPRDPTEIPMMWWTSAEKTQQLQSALQGVMDWTEDVVHGLVSLQWQVVGYHSLPDGTPDYSRPHHNIPNPEAVISRILGTYASTTREQLMLLMQAMDQSAGTSYSSSSVPSLPPNIPTGDNYRYPVPTHTTTNPYTPRPSRAHITPKRFRNQPDPHQHPQIAPRLHHSHRHPFDSNDMNNDNNESRVAYVLAQPYKSKRTGERLGFPAYSQNRQLLGFYGDSHSWHPLIVGDFNPAELWQATEILNMALVSQSKAVHCIQDWGSISSLLDHATVYDWSKDIGLEASLESTSSPNSEDG